MNPGPAIHSVASVVLNYNSDEDVMTLVPQLLAQEGVDHDIIIIDNASRQECVQRLVDWLHDYPDVVIGTPKEVSQRINDSPVHGQRLFFVLNRENRGYSTGNNIGIRLAERLRSKAVLIANPDMRIEGSLYILRLADALFSNGKNYVAASRIVDLHGNDQNPLREPTFWEELLWPRQYLYKLMKKKISYSLVAESGASVSVPKVSGCCQMISMAFLKTINYLDENVFLYCEEPILSARVREQDGHIVFVPGLSAIHAHEEGLKGNANQRMLLFIQSRKYYLRFYSRYGYFRLRALFFSYALLALLQRIKSLK